MSVSTYVVGIGETARVRHPDALQTTMTFMRDAVQMALDDAGLELRDIDGFAVASFSLEPDRAIDVAWRLGLSVNWLLQDTNGGASAINMLGHAVRGIESGTASNILILGGDLTRANDFIKRVMDFNSATRDHLAPLAYGGPNSLFAMLTKRQMKKFDLLKSDYGHLAIAQRQWAAGNPIAAYRTPLTMEDYLNAPMVSDPLCRYDCVPVVAGASAMIVSSAPRRGAEGSPVQVLAVRQSFNPDNQEGDGLETGIRALAPGLWGNAGVAPSEVDVVSVYDDYPALAYAQLADLGFIPGDDIARFAREVMSARLLPVNTGGGMLSCGQAGSGSGVHGIVEVVRQLQHRAGTRQVAEARLGVASGYGMALYRYCACAGAVVLQGKR
jgi:acetyl-CoA acetyltransferase